MSLASPAVSLAVWQGRASHESCHVESWSPPPASALPGLSLYPIRGTLPLTTEVFMNKSAMIRARVDPVLKDEVEKVFEQLGLSATQAITLFYQQVRLNRGLPFDVRVPNAVTQRTFAETDAGQNIVCCENAEDLFARLGI